MFYLLLTYLFTVVLSSNSSTNTCNQYKENYEYLLNDYHSLYNTSLNLYQECTKSLDNYMELYDNEQAVNDICMEKIQEYERIAENLTQSVNYTKHVSLLKENVKLESDLYLVRTNLTERLDICQEKNKVSYLVIANYKEEIANFKNNFTDLTHEIYQLDLDMKQCQRDLQQQLKEQAKIFVNLKDCLEREDVLLQNKDKFVNRLASCRKNNRKLKDKNPATPSTS